MAMVEFLDGAYHVDDKLMKYWEKFGLEKLFKQNTDRFYIVDGRERAGKSTWTIQQACALDPDMKDLDVFLSRICFTPEQFDYACKTVKNGVIIFDEAFRGFGSRSALSKTNKKLITTLMEMGQNNNIVFLVLPSFFMLDIYPAMLRSNALFNIYIDKKTGKRTWRGYNFGDKNKIYQMGLKKGWNYSFKTKFKGRFYDNRKHTKFAGGMKFYLAYEKKKGEAFKEIKDKEDYTDDGENKWLIQRDILLANIFYYIKEKEKITQTSFVKWLEELGMPMEQANISKRIGKVRKEGHIIPYSL